jgi:hypothetical protein
MSINGQKTDAALAPDKMRKSDRNTMYTTTVDVASLPGGWNQTKGFSEELFAETQKMAQLTSTILQSTGKLKQMEVQDTTWNSTLRHSLGKIKNRDNVLEFMKKLRKSRKSGFKQQDNLIEHFLYRRVTTRASTFGPTFRRAFSQKLQMTVFRISLIRSTLSARFPLISLSGKADQQKSCWNIMQAS